MIALTPELRFKIDDIIAAEAADAADEQKKYPDSISFGLGVSNEVTDSMMDSILDGPAPRHVNLLEQLLGDELVYVYALTLFGRRDGFEHKSFDYVLQYCKNNINDGTISYLSEKPLSKYLTQGLKSLGAL